MILVGILFSLLMMFLCLVMDVACLSILSFMKMGKIDKKWVLDLAGEDEKLSGNLLK